MSLVITQAERSRKASPRASVYSTGIRFKLRYGDYRHATYLALITTFVGLAGTAQKGKRRDSCRVGSCDTSMKHLAH